MGRWAKTCCLLWLAAASLLAAPLFDEPVAKLALKDGTVLRDAQARGFLTKVVMVRYQGGIRTVPYELFPDEFKAALAVRRQAVLTGTQVEQVRHDAAAQKRAQTQTAPPAATPAASVTPPTIASEPDLHDGCRVTLASSKGNVVILKIENTNDHAVTLTPAQFGARTGAGEEYAGASWVGIYYKEGPEATAWRSQRSVDPGATVTLALTLTAAPDLKDGSIETVFWK